MAKIDGWKLDPDKKIPIDFTADVAEGQLVTLAGAVAGVGDIPIGAVDRNIDISEDGARGEAVMGPVHVGKAAAAVTAGNFIKAAAAGTVTPVTADKDYAVGIALTSQSTVGGTVKYIWQPGYYAV